MQFVKLKEKRLGILHTVYRWHKRSIRILQLKQAFRFITNSIWNKCLVAVQSSIHVEHQFNNTQRNKFGSINWKVLFKFSTCKISCKLVLLSELMMVYGLYLFNSVTLIFIILGWRWSFYFNSLLINGWFYLWVTFTFLITHFLHKLFINLSL